MRLALAGVLLCLALPASAQDRTALSRQCNGPAESEPRVRIEACTALIAIPGQNQMAVAVMYHNRGRAHASLGDYDRAIADYNQATRLDALNTDAFTSRGSAYVAKGEFARAMPDFDRGLLFTDKNVAALAGRCRAGAALGKLKEALADCDSALRLRPANVEAADSRGLVHLLARRYDAAIEDYDLALRIGPKRASSLYGRGIARRGKGDLVAAEVDISAAVALQLDIVQVMTRYGVR